MIYCIVSIWESLLWEGESALKSLDPVVKKETIYIAAWVLILCTLMNAVFLVLKQWNLPVLFGTLLGGGTAVLNFLLMGLTVQSAVTKEEKEAKTLIKTSQSLRLVMQLVAVVIAAAIPAAFNLWATLIPLLFPRVAMLIRPLFKKND